MTSSGSSKDDNASGYRGAALGILSGAGAGAGDTVEIESKNGSVHRGLLMPRYEHDDDTHIVVKLASGYNVGVDTHAIEKITVSEKREGVAGVTATKAGSKKDSRTRNRKRILLLSTGGTIASRVDYRTGGVTPVLSADELADSIPELGEIAEVDAEVVTSEYSENITPEHWLALARRIDEHADKMAKDGGDDYSGNTTKQQPYSGIIIAHGTDTMHYTSAFLSFALAGFPAPIVLVGAQRSSDRASSDAATNLVAAARFIASYKCSAVGGGGGVYVAMHNGTGDESIAFHLGTRVRKNHTSRRDAFQTVGADPAFLISAASSEIIRGAGPPGRFFASASYTPKISLDQGVALVKYHPGYDPKMLDHIIDSGCRAIIFEGTGLGHVGRTLYGQISRAAKDGIFLGMTSQCIEGRVAMTVYESGRDLASMGVVQLGDIIPEVALVKAMWASSCADGAGGIKDIMLGCVASEMAV